MGAAVSTNVTKTTTNAVTKVMTKIINSASTQGNSSQIISVSNVQGNVDISGNKFNTVITVNMSALFTSLNSTDVKQDLVQQLSQDAKAMIKDINVGNISDASNALDSYLTDTISITSNLSQRCTALANTSQQLLANNIEGNVTINNNSFTSFLDLTNSCIGKAISSSSAVNDLQNILSQTSSASTTGVSIWGLAAVGLVVIIGIGLVVIGPEVVPLIAAGKNPKILGLILIIFSLVFFAIWYFWTSDDFSSTAFAVPLKNSCAPTSIIKTQIVSSPDEAARIAQTIKGCAGFDFTSWTQEGEVWRPLEQKTATFYSSIGSNCSIQTDSSPILIPRKMIVCNNVTDITADILKTLKIGDVRLQPNNASYYLLTSQTQNTVSWSSAKRLNENVSSIKLVSGVDFLKIGEPFSPNGFDLTTDESLLEFVLTQNKSRDVTTFKATGPGYTVTKESPNVSGILIKKRSKTWALYTGIAILILGILLALFLKPKQQTKEQEKKTSFFSKFKFNKTKRPNKNEGILVEKIDAKNPTKTIVENVPKVEVQKVEVPKVKEKMD